MAEKKLKKKNKKKLIIILALFLAALLAAFWFRKKKQAEDVSTMAKSVQTGTAVRMDLTSELTASSTLEPKDTYEVTSLVEGEILEASFEEGDVVEKGQILYLIDSADMDSNVSSAETSLQRASEKLTSAQSDYSEAAGEISGNAYRSTASGYLKNIQVKEGDRVSNGTKIGDLYDDSIMKLTVPFLTAEAEQIVGGNGAVITLEDTGEQLEGTVTAVSSLEETLTGGRLVKSITIEVVNPGGLTSSMAATASVGDFVCGQEGTFVPKTETELTVRLSGNGNLEVETMQVSEGGRIDPGTGIFTVTSQSAEKYLKTFRDSVNSASDDLENAGNQLTNTRDNVEDYTITAPISGTVITKSAKTGDKISRGTGEASAMAVIYDLSTMTLKMSVDELDVSKVKVGQAVEITADAIEGEVFTGKVTNVSLQGSISNGVTNYPVTVTLDDTGDLLPGMNVDAKIILDSAEQTLCIPAGALMRGNRVYVKDTEGKAGAGKGAGTEAGQENADGSNAGSGRKSADGTAQGAGHEAADGVNAGSGNKADRENAGRDANVPEGFHAVQVETGIINDEYVEILSGLSEGDVVYVDPNAGSGSSSMMMFQMGGGMPMGGGMGGSAGGPPSGGGGRRP